MTGDPMQPRRTTARRHLLRRRRRHGKDRDPGRGRRRPARDTWVTVTGTWRPKGTLGSDEAWPPVLDAVGVAVGVGAGVAAGVAGGVAGGVAQVKLPADPYGKP
ncbi:hypothetical protein [Streptomyces sp. NPDC050121]|uniref:hypothetical protein n=1 Tax=Streptomyces sp. NPDC050121 TaxID=3365601 RepID=UPI00379B4F7B